MADSEEAFLPPTSTLLLACVQRQSQYAWIRPLQHSIPLLLLLARSHHEGNHRTLGVFKQYLSEATKQRMINLKEGASHYRQLTIPQIAILTTTLCDNNTHSVQTTEIMDMGTGSPSQEAQARDILTEQEAAKQLESIVADENQDTRHQDDEMSDNPEEDVERNCEYGSTFLGGLVIK